MLKREQYEHSTLMSQRETVFAKLNDDVLLRNVAVIQIYITFIYVLKLFQDTDKK